MSKQGQIILKKLSGYSPLKYSLWMTLFLSKEKQLHVSQLIGWLKMVHDQAVNTLNFQVQKAKKARHSAVLSMPLLAFYVPYLA